MEVQQLAEKIERYMLTICAHYAEHGSIPDSMHTSVHVDGRDNADEAGQAIEPPDQGVDSEAETLAEYSGGNLDKPTEEAVDAMFSPLFSTYMPMGSDSVAHEGGK